MSGQAVNQFVDRLAQIDVLEVSRFADSLATEITEVEKKPLWTFYEFELRGLPFERGQLRLAASGEQALLSLWPPENSTLVEDDLELSQRGEVSDLRFNPRIPPEGTVTYVYEVEGVQIGFQLTHDSRRLRSIAMEWGEEAE